MSGGRHELVLGHCPRWHWCLHHACLFVLLLSGVTFPERVIRILDHVGPAVMAALVVTTLTGSEGQLEAGPSSF